MVAPQNETTLPNLWPNYKLNNIFNADQYADNSDDGNSDYNIEETPPVPSSNI